MPLAYTPALDGLTGEMRFDVSTNTWEAGDPDAEALLHCVRTELGTYLPDPTFGFNYALIQKREPNSEAIIRGELLRCTARVVRIRGLTDVVARVEFQGKLVVMALEYVTRSGRQSQISTQVTA